MELQSRELPYFPKQEPTCSKILVHQAPLPSQVNYRLAPRGAIYGVDVWGGDQNWPLTPILKVKQLQEIDSPQ